VRNEYIDWLKGKNQDTSYKTCEESRVKIDELLRLNASLQANLGSESTPEEHLSVENKTEELMLKIKQIDPDFHDIVNIK